MFDAPSVPVSVNVGLLGFAGDGAWGVELRAAELHGLLSRLLPSRSPLCGPDGVPARFGVDIAYNIVQMKTGLPQLEQGLASAMRPVPSSSDRYEIRVSDAEDHFERIHDSYFGQTQDATILIVNPNRATMVEHVSSATRSRAEPFSYHYVMDSTGGAHVPTQMWLARKRYLVLDISAGPAIRGMAGATEGAVSSQTIPQVSSVLQGGASATTVRASDTAAAAEHALGHSHLLARLTTLVVSAVRHAIVPDMRSCVLAPPSERLVVPIVVLRNHRAFDPLVPGHARSLNVARLREAIAEVVPRHQEVTLLPSTHDVHDHPQISVALTRSMRADTAFEQRAGGGAFSSAQPYVDARTLTHELRHSVDWLAAGLIERSETPPRLAIEHLHERWSNASSRGRRGAPAAGEPIVRVMPLFVFSLVGMHPSLLLDRTSLVHTSDHAVLVLQTNESALDIPFYANSADGLAIPTYAPTSHAIAGLASALGAVVAPFESFGAAGGAPERDFHWAVGHHPFGPFSHAPILPQLMIDAAQRHQVLARIGAAADMLRDTAAALADVASRFLQPSESGSNAPAMASSAIKAFSPGHWRAYERIAELRAHPALDIQAAVARLEEDASGAPSSSHSAAQRLRKAGPVEGGLLHQLRMSAMSLCSAEVSATILHQYDALRLHEAALKAATAAVAGGELDKAARQADTLHRAVHGTAVAALERMQSLETSLSCCTVEATRPRSYHLGALGALIVIGIAVWMAVLRLASPARRRGGEQLRFRPGESIWGRPAAWSRMASKQNID